MIKIIKSQCIKRGTVHATIEIHRDGYKAIAFGKRKAQAIIEAIRDKDALAALEEFSGYAQADRESATHAAEAADRAKYNDGWKAQGKEATA